MLISAYEVCLERVAEELMGRRKWKHYQETLTRTHLNTDQLTATIDQLNIEPKAREHVLKLDDSNSVKVDSNPQQQQQQQPAVQREDITIQQPYEANHRQEEKSEDQAKRHHSSEKDAGASIKLKKEAETETEKEQAKDTQYKRAASAGIEENLTKLCIEESREDNNNSNTTTSHKHNNNNNSNTSSKSETTNITDAQLSCPHTNHSDLLTNLRLRRVLRPDSPTTPPTAPPLASASETDTETQPKLVADEPIDWKPNEKCYFCIDGKLLTVNAKGKLVAESGPALSEADHAHRQQLLDTESDSNDSCAQNSTSASNTGTTSTATGNQRAVSVNKLLASRLRDLPANMTSMDSMAARLAAIRSISGQLYPNLDFNWLLAQQQQQQQQQQANSATTPTTSDTSATAVSPALKDSPSPSDATGEQPLDLSSKPSPNSSISGDLKSSTRSKPSRATPVPPAGRRTYTDDDLTNALQDILSGKLGTRKAAVQYNIPRSTLRNKVYKLSMDEKRSNATAPAELLHQLQALDRDALSADEESNDSSAPPETPQTPHALDDLASRIATSATLRKLCETNNAEEASGSASPKQTATTITTAATALEQLKRQSSTPHANVGPPQTSPQPQMAPILIDPNMLLQTLLLSAGALQNSATLQPKLDETVTLRDLFGAILFNSGINLKDALAAATNSTASGDNLNNGSGKPPSMLDQRLLLQQLQQQTSPSHAHFSQRLPKSDTPETSSSLDLNEASDDPSVILKIPSYKPVAGSSSTAASASQAAATASSASHSPSAAQQCGNNASTNRNGDSPHSQRSAQSPRIANSMLAAAVAAAAGGGNATAAHQQPNSISVISPPLMRHSLSTDSQSPPSFSLRDVIANSIHRTMNEQANKDAHAAAASMLGLGGVSEAERSASGDYKTPSISVVKNIGGTDTSRFGKAPNLLANAVGSSHNSHHHHHHHPHHHLQHAHHSTHHLSRQEAAALAAGKGTRPKRGKYRNYDRDSLVEAVKAVQRGEMSVHRAGSYYGVPHSTLEYKVKERHLMRPRKREPKPQPLDGSGAVGGASTTKANSNIPGHATTSNLDKLKAGNTSTSSSKLSGALKNNSNAAAFPNTSPNGMKLSMFDPNVAAAQMQYAPHLFWPHSAAAFGPLQMDFNRNAAQAGNAVGVGASPAANTPVGNASPYVNADILKSHIQRYQEESMRSASGSSANAHKSAHSPSPIASPMPGQNHHALNYKSAREMAENLYESGGNANGSASSSFLDGIIRKTLDRKSNDVAPPPSGGALLDQLLVKKMPLPFTNNRSNDYASTSGGQLKRAGSPLSYAGVDIKRERSSPLHSDEASNSEAEEHNNNNRLASGNGGHGGVIGLAQQHQQQRSRMTSRDSDTDASSGSQKSALPHELLTSQHYNNNSSNNMSDLNGGRGEGAGRAELGSMGSTSILQEKLGQIKAERDSEENL